MASFDMEYFFKLEAKFVVGFIIKVLPRRKKVIVQGISHILPKEQDLVMGATVDKH